VAGEPNFMTMTTLQRSPLHEMHAHAGAKFIDFYGWELPVQFTSIMDEHQAVRKAAGLFDISHMGQVIIEGPGAFDFIQHLITNDLQRTFDKHLGVYAHLCLPTGGVIDDIFVYGLKDGKNSDRFFMVVNGSTHEKDVAWLRKNAPSGVTITDLERRAGFAIQGPKALEIIRKTLAGVAELPRFAFQQIVGGGPNETFWACRTGYTGEDGAEFFGPAMTIKTLWKQLLENGESEGLRPCGLGARDTLRLEMGYPLYGHELTEEHTSLEAGLEWAVKWNKGDFIGREALWKQKQEGVKTKLLAYELLERGVPRGGSKIYKDGVFGGETASGTFSPSLQKGIGLVFAPAAWAVPGTKLEVEIHNKRVPAAVVTVPFYKK
jgi:aminomethyltransferase